MNDRIKLAEAMGWREMISAPGNWYPPGMPPQANALGHELPDPFTDANDDYAVLEWMRSDINRWTYQFKPELISFGLELYEPGDYARAALKVLDNE